MIKSVYYPGLSKDIFIKYLLWNIVLKSKTNINIKHMSSIEYRSVTLNFAVLTGISDRLYLQLKLGRLVSYALNSSADLIKEHRNQFKLSLEEE